MKVTNYNELKMVATFTDGDTRTITVKDPNPTNIGQKIGALETYAANVLIGDKYGAAFNSFQDARIVAGTKVDLEIGK